MLISCDAGQKKYPAYSSPTVTNTGTNGDEQCRQDVTHFINAVIRDLEFGSNYNVIDAAKEDIVDGVTGFVSKSDDSENLVMVIVIVIFAMVIINITHIYNSGCH